MLQPYEKEDEVRWRTLSGSGSQCSAVRDGRCGSSADFPVHHHHYFLLHSLSPLFVQNRDSYQWKFVQIFVLAIIIVLWNSPLPHSHSHASTRLYRTNTLTRIQNHGQTHIRLIRVGACVCVRARIKRVELLLFESSAVQRRIVQTNEQKYDKFTV